MEKYNLLKSIGWIVAGNFIFALSVSLFIMPVGLITGGSTGIALTVNNYTGLPVTIFVYIFNITMLILGWIFMGKKFALTTIVSTFIYPTALGIWTALIGDYVLTDDLLLCAIFSGLGIGIALAMWWYLNHTTAGLRLRSVGENPGAADSVGINVKRTKYLHICLGCGIMGIGGYYMGLNMSGSFNSSCWINGYGWIAVALVIFANWNPAMAILGTFVFGFFNTLRVSGSSLAAAFPGVLGWLSSVPTQLYQALPFIITAIVLVGSSIRKKQGSGMPASLGINYFREER